MKSFLAKTYRKFFNDTVQGDEVSSRKRKRFDESDFETVDDSVVITAVKRPRLTSETTGHQIPFFSYLYNPYQKMSDWVKNKCSWNDIFSFRKMDSNDRSKWNRQGNAQPNGQTSLNRPVPSSMNPPFQPPGSKKVSFVKSTISTQTDNEISALNGDNFTEDSISECDSISRGTQYKHPKGGSLFDIKTIKPTFTATEYVRLDEKERYRQLLKQFTDVPLPSSKEQTQQNREPSKLYTSTIQNESILGSSIKIDLNQISQPSKGKVTARPAPRDSSVLIHRHSTPINRTLNNSYARQQLAAKAKKEAELSTIICDNTSNKDKEISIDLTTDTQSEISRRVPPAEFKDSKFIHDDWLTNLKSKYSSTVRERERKINEEIIKSKLFEERRKTEAENLEKELRQRMRIFEKEPPVVEDLPVQVEEEEEEEELPPLTDDMLEKIKSALRPSPPDQVLVEGYKLQVTRKDIATLGGLNWLNDEIINFYMNMLTERGEKEGYPKVYTFNTFFYPKLLSGGHSAVKRWTRRVDVFAVDYIIVPVHLGMHWCLSIVDFKKKSVRYFDSMGGNNVQCLNAMKQYLCDESLDKKKTKFDLTGWTTDIAKDIPQQMNGSDCGMFACKYAEYITREAKITFTQQHMPYFRKRMVYEILTKTLLQ